MQWRCRFWPRIWAMPLYWTSCKWSRKTVSAIHSNVRFTTWGNNRAESQQSNVGIWRPSNEYEDHKLSLALTTFALHSKLRHHSHNQPARLTISAATSQYYLLTYSCPQHVRMWHHYLLPYEATFRRVNKPKNSFLSSIYTSNLNHTPHHQYK